MDTSNGPSVAPRGGRDGWPRAAARNAPRASGAGGRRAGDVFMARVGRSGDLATAADRAPPPPPPPCDGAGGSRVPGLAWRSEAERRRAQRGTVTPGVPAGEEEGAGPVERANWKHVVCLPKSLTRLPPPRDGRARRAGPGGWAGGRVAQGGRDGGKVREGVLSGRAWRREDCRGRIGRWEEER
ncbi:unnamed protein product [Lampetra planeri]